MSCGAIPDERHLFIYVKFLTLSKSSKLYCNLLYSLPGICNKKSK